MTSQFVAVALTLLLGACAHSPSSEFTRLMRAAASGEEHSVARLLEEGSDPNAVDGSGVTALALAAQFGRAEVCALLLRSGADANLADTEGVTPLMKAARFGHEAAVDELLRAGADRARRDAKGRNAASWARSSGNGDLAERLMP